MAYKNFRSTFDIIADVIASVANPGSAALVNAATVRVTQLLEARFPEETEGTEDLRVDFARQRIAGTIEKLNDLRARAANVGALPDFIVLIDGVHREAAAAFERAPTRNVPAVPEPAAWAIDPIKPVKPVDRSSTLPDWLRDI